MSSNYELLAPFNQRLEEDDRDRLNHDQSTSLHDFFLRIKFEKPRMIPCSHFALRFTASNQCDLL